jgi:hypothetical protein
MDERDMIGPEQVTQRRPPGAPAPDLPIRREHPSTSVAASAGGLCAIAALLVAGGLLAAGAAGHRVVALVPASLHGYPGWMRGPLAGLGVRLDVPESVLLLGALLVGYLVVLACSAAISPRMAIGAVVALHAIFLLAPPLFSADVFGYIDYAHLGVLHGLDPYRHGAAAAAGDPAAPFVRWHDVASPYGPLFTIASYALAHLSVPVALWVYKGLAAAAGLGCVALVWRIAERAGRDPRSAALFVGLNPLFVVYGVGGAHNDLLVELFVLAGIWAVLSQRDGRAGLQIGLAVLLKVPAGLVLPFACAGARRRGRLIAGTLAGTLGVGVAVVAVGGSEMLGFVAQVVQQQQLVARFSVPNELGVMLGLGGITAGLRVVCAAAFAAAAGWSLVRAWRGADWIAGAGWATLAGLLTSAWLTPWYAIWVLPLAAIGSSRRLRLASLVFCAYLVATRVVPHLT